jgi:hypothetical protein
MLFARRRAETPPAGAGVALLLPSGRTLSATLRGIDGEGALVLDVAGGGAVPPGCELELRWEGERGWHSLATVALQARSGSHRDAGRLRLGPQERPRTHRNRRGGSRHKTALRVRARVERSLNLAPGSELVAFVEDASGDGLAFDTEALLEPGDRLQVELVGEDGLGIGRAAAHVARAERPPGALRQRVGLVLDDAPAAVLEALAELEAR